MDDTSKKMVKIVNNTNTHIGIQLNDRDYIQLKARTKGSNSHISKAIETINLPDYITKKQGMIARGEVSLIDA